MENFIFCAVANSWKAGTNVKFSDNEHKFSESIPGVNKY